MIGTGICDDSLKSILVSVSLPEQFEIYHFSNGGLRIKEYKVPDEKGSLLYLRIGLYL